MRSSRPVIIALVSLSAIVGLMIVLTFRTTAQSRTELRERFTARAAVASRFLEAYVGELAEQQRSAAETRLTGTSRAAFEELVGYLGVDAAVLLDNGGRLLAVYPHRADIIGNKLSDDYAHLATAVGGSVGVSGVVPSAARGDPLIAIATPFDREKDRLVFSAGHTVANTPLHSYVTNISPIGGTRAYIVDRQGSVVAGAGTTGSRGFADVDPALARAIDDGDGSTYEADDGTRFVATSAVDGTPWQIVLSVPQATLFAPLAGATTWMPWLTAIGLAATAIMLAILFLRLGAQRAELGRALDEQERLSAALNEFSGRVAHDLRSPLTVAKGWAEVAENSPDLRAEANATIRKAIDRAVTLIDDLLAFAHGGAVVSLSDVDLPQLVSEVTSDVENATIEVGPLPEVVRADRVALSRAIENLVQNAARYGRANGTAAITISGRELPESWRIEVGDRGPGVAPDEAEAIFEAFKRGTETETPGTGLGLAIVASVAEAHNGRAWYEPRDGGGSIFVIEIPKAATGTASGGS